MTDVTLETGWDNDPASCQRRIGYKDGPSRRYDRTHCGMGAGSWSLCATTSEAVVQVNQDRRLKTAEAGCMPGGTVSDATESFTMVLPIQSPSGLTGGTGKSLILASTL